MVTNSLSIMPALMTIPITQKKSILALINIVESITGSFNKEALADTITSKPDGNSIVY
ncbi:hypothetical protein [Nitrososphaera sp. AFS]|uniref:hypothetical protein n=1 Tax=Nitrososphaera sp. AFS TaxID=2301191 RepID=UPI001F33B718|nr:hypothetical protein [Nitrososphaera sp. AFS]